MTDEVRTIPATVYACVLADARLIGPLTADRAVEWIEFGPIVTVQPGMQVQWASAAETVGAA